MHKKRPSPHQPAAPFVPPNGIDGPCCSGKGFFLFGIHRSGRPVFTNTNRGHPAAPEPLGIPSPNRGRAKIFGASVPAIAYHVRSLTAIEALTKLRLTRRSPLHRIPVQGKPVHSPGRPRTGPSPDPAGSDVSVPKRRWRAPCSSGRTREARVHAIQTLRLGVAPCGSSDLPGGGIGCNWRSVRSAPQPASTAPQPSSGKRETTA